MPKPSVFIGSSSENLEFARAIRSLLAQDAEVTVWQEGTFSVGSVTLEVLLQSKFDFAVLVLAPDDVTTSRADTMASPRDNVIFELGLFMGRLGRKRTFMVSPREGSVKLPSDVAGVQPAYYDWPRSDHDVRAAVGPACDDIRRAIRTLGLWEGRLGVHIQAVEDRQDRQQQTIDALTFVVAHFLPDTEFGHLERLVSEQPFPYQMHAGFEAELRHLRALGFIKTRREGIGIRSLPREGNLREFFEVSSEGRTYLELRAAARDSD